MRSRPFSMLVAFLTCPTSNLEGGQEVAPLFAASVSESIPVLESVPEAPRLSSAGVKGAHSLTESDYYLFCFFFFELNF